MDLSKKTYYMPYDEFLYENIEALLYVNGYATEQGEIQRLLLEENQPHSKRFVEVIILKS